MLRQALTAAFTSVISDVLAQYLTGTPLVSERVIACSALDAALTLTHRFCSAACRRRVQSNLNYTSIRNQLLIGLFVRSVPAPPPHREPSMC